MERNTQKIANILTFLFYFSHIGQNVLNMQFFILVLAPLYKLYKPVKKALEKKRYPIIFLLSCVYLYFFFFLLLFIHNNVLSLLFLLSSQTLYHISQPTVSTYHSVTPIKLIFNFKHKLFIGKLKKIVLLRSQI